MENNNSFPKRNFVGFLSQRQKIEEGLINLVPFDKSGLTPEQIKQKEEKQSRPILVCEAKTLEDQYVSSSRIMIGGTAVRKPVPLQTSNGSAIDGFYYPIEHIRTLMDVIDNIKGIYLGLGEYPNGQGRTLILYGVKSDGNVHKEDNEIFDYSEPCPCKCPNGNRDHTCI